MSDPYSYSPPITTSSQGNATVTLVLLLIVLVISVFMVASVWRMFTKAGKPGWASIVPIYNSLILLEIIGRPWWWLLLFFVPFVGLVLAFIMYVELAKVFGKSLLFGVFGLAIFPFVGFPVLGFGPAKYSGPLTHAPSA